MAETNPPAPAPLPEASQKEVADVLDAVVKQNDTTFETAVKQLDTADELKALAAEVSQRQEQEETLSLSVRQRNALRAQIDGLKDAAIKENVKKDPKVRRLIMETVLSDTRTALAKPAKWVGEKFIDFLHGAENIPGVGPVLKEVSYFFGTTTPEAVKNAGSFILHWGQKLLWNVLASPALIGMEGTPFIGSISKYAQEQLLRLQANEMITSAIDDEKQQQDLTVSFDKRDPANAWKMLTPAQKQMDWYAQSRQYIQSQVKTGKGGADKPIVITIGALTDLAKTQKEEADKQNAALAEKTLTAWNLPSPSTVKFEGTKVRLVRSGASTTLSFPNVQQLKPDGTALTPEALKLKDALTLLPSANEVEIGSGPWELRKNGTSVVAAIPAAAGEPDLAKLNTVTKEFTSSKAATLQLDTQSLPTGSDTPHVKYVQSGSVLKWNGKGTLDTMLDFFTKNKEALGNATADSLWKFDGTNWSVVPTA